MGSTPGTLRRDARSAALFLVLFGVLGSAMLVDRRTPPAPAPSLDRRTDPAQPLTTFTVRGPDQRPIAGVQFKLLSTHCGASAYQSVLAHAVTDPQGIVTLRLPASHWVIRVRAPHWQPVWISDRELRERGPELVMLPAAMLIGYVLGLDPEWRAQLRLQRRVDRRASRAACMSQSHLELDLDADGWFQTTEIAGGTWQASVWIAWKEQQVQSGRPGIVLPLELPPVHLVPDRERCLTIDARPARCDPAPGEVTFAGRPVAGARLLWLPLEGRSFARVGPVRISDGGSFRMPPLPAGRWQVELMLPDPSGRPGDGIALDDPIVLDPSWTHPIRPLAFPERTLLLRVARPGGSADRVGFVLHSNGAEQRGRLDENGTARIERIAGRRFSVSIDGHHAVLSDRFPLGGGELTREVTLPR